MAMTAAASTADRPGREARKARRSGRCPCRHSCQYCWSAERSRREMREGRGLPLSLIVDFFQSQLAGDTGDGPGQLLAAGLGRAADLPGDVGPFASQGAQVGELPLLV